MSSSPVGPRRQTEMGFGLDEIQVTQQIIRPEAAIAIERHSTTSKLACDIFSHTLAYISELLDQDAMYAPIIRPENIQGVTAKIARQVVFRLWHEEVSLSSLTNPEEISKRLEDIQKAIVEQFNEWWLMWRGDHYTASADTPAEKDFIRSIGPIDWGDPQCINALYVTGANGEPKGAHSVVDAKKTVAAIERLLGSSPLRRSTFDTVRKAEYCHIKPYQMDIIMPKIADSYELATLKPEILALLVEGRIEEFIEQTRKGVFIEGFHEKIKGISIHENMQHHLLHTPNSYEPTYQGRFLHDRKGKILSWMTYWQPPPVPTQEYIEFVLKYLRRGTTGVMQYSRRPGKKDIEKNAGTTVLIDTIRSETPFAGTRLMTHVMDEIFSKASYVERLIGYYLNDIEMIEPQIEHTSYPHLSYNASSSKFFGARGCVPFATDGSSRSHLFKRKLPNGQMVKLRQIWTAFVASFHYARQRSAENWHDIQSVFGDVTHDKSGPPSDFRISST